MSVVYLFVFFGKMSVYIFFLFLNQIIHFWGVEFYNFFVDFGYNPLSNMSFANIFSHSIGCPLVLLIVSLAVQKLFILMESQQFIFCFCFPYLRRHIQKEVAMTKVKEGTACVLHQDFYGFRPHIQVFNPFLIYFSEWGKKVVQFHSSTYCCPVFPTPFIEETVFFPLDILFCFVAD